MAGARSMTNLSVLECQSMQEASTQSVAFVLHEGFVSSIITYHLALTREHVETSLIIILPLEGARTRFQPNGTFTLPSGRKISIRYSTYSAIYSDPSAALEKASNILLWNHEANKLLVDNQITALVNKLDAFIRTQSIFAFYPDGLVGFSWNTDRILEFIQTSNLSIDQARQLFLATDTGIFNRFLDVGIQCIAATATDAIDVLRIMKTNALLYLDSARINNVRSNLGCSPLVVALRPWHTDFHGGVYRFGHKEVCDDMAADIFESYGHAKSSFSDQLSSQITSIVICADQRTLAFADGLKDAILAAKRYVPAILLNELFGEGGASWDLSLESILPSFCESMNPIIYCFDSNSSVLMHMAKLPIRTIHGAPESLLSSQGASENSVRYIRQNVQRIIRFASPSVYSSKQLDPTLVYVEPL